MLLAATMGFVLATMTGDDPKAGRKLVWRDEFSRSGAPDPKKWTYEVGRVRNDEAQYYTKNRLKNARVEKDHLLIEARKESWEGATCTSASLTSIPSWKDVYIEVRAKFPTGKGTWPAIWLLGDVVRLTGDEHVGWPLCGEIDMMENVGWDPDKVHFSVHTQDHNHTKGTQITQAVEARTPYKEFHTYGLNWLPNKLDFYFDGKLVLTYANDGGGPTTWPFDKPAYLILNLAIGGSWGAVRGVDDSIFPAQFSIDYVRVYK